ncbi:cell division cycle-associated protein 2 isoform X2 [Diceros bicornis minor]|nr:cell division cycle-associated protein 2 isoform X2 [Diceros bicornis minor]XP_058406472.1 cell division cycle-associated protein 2 isoform X2 [Diceros bicornis minor]XP_058406474.1 cell division cycle-associated protein 2 isoform X2 [Diceros bicornis minor]XP_058406475.1 cell division cycle-associated protein 2 isoform X2 [Diceros bicornis minor]XP_058406476.1 cell division cycle-associated protein 2 isoform X2 [Diceros bicornis minor]
MDTNFKDSKLPETKESAVNNAENASLVFGNGNLVTPQKHARKVTPNCCTPDSFKSPLNFSSVTVERLGITPDSFVKNSSGKSSSYLKKSRRRSTVGARGSPETNHLIRFIAQQRNLKNAEKSPLTQNSPFQRESIWRRSQREMALHLSSTALVSFLNISATTWMIHPASWWSQGSPVLYQNVNSLRERISAFQSAFHSIKENEKMTDCPEFSEAEGEFKTTGLTKKENVGECQLSEFLAKSSSKRRRISSQSTSDENLTGTVGLQIVSIATSSDAGRMCAVETSLADLSEKSSESGLTQSGWLVEESVPLPELTEDSGGIKVADCVEGRGSCDAVSLDKFTQVSTDTAPEVRSPVIALCRRDSPSSETIVLRSVLKKPSLKLCLESLQEHCDNLCDDGTHPSLISNLTNCCKERKAEGEENCKVSACLNMRKRKRVTFGEELSPEVFDESLPANTPLRKGGTPVRKKDSSDVSPLLLEQSPVPERLPQPNFDDKGENLENIEPLPVSFAVLSPLKSSISETLSGTDTFSSSKNHEKISSHGVGRITRTSNRRSQLLSFAEESVCSLFNTEAQPCKEKKINRRKSQGSKRTDRGLPKKNQVLKSCRKKKGKGKKSVQKSLYGEREIASKKPLLSPILELPEVSEMTPSGPSVRRMCRDDFNSNGELEEVKLAKRKTLLLQNPEDFQMNQRFNKYHVSEFCSSYIKSSSLLVNATFDQDSDINTPEINDNKNISKAEIKLESQNERKTGTENGNSHVSYASVTEKPIVSDNPKPDFILQSQEFSASGQNVENPFRIFKILEDINIKCEKPDDFLVATEGKLQTKHLMSDLQKECDCSEDVLIDITKESKNQSEDLGRNSAESSGVNCRARKQRRHSMYYSDGQSLHLEKNGSHKASCSMSSSAEISLGNSELYKDLSNSIEQTFQRTNSETKVRRSTRLQKDVENEGLVWISLPFPSISCTSQRTKRRTICTVDSRGFESVSFRQKPCTPPSTSGRENSEGFAASSPLPGKRRKSFCTSTLANTESTTRSKCYKRRSFLRQKEESPLNDVERSGHTGALKQ